jgi:hypothetical protein
MEGGRASANVHCNQPTNQVRTSDLQRTTNERITWLGQVYLFSPYLWSS